MTYEIKKLQKQDLRDLLLDDINSQLRDFYSDDIIDLLYEDKSSASIWYGGHLLLCGGLTVYWKGRAQIWTMFSSISKYHFVPAFRGIKHYLNLQPHRRIELCVPIDNNQAKRRALLLGFELECARARAFLSDGTDCALFSKVRD